MVRLWKLNGSPLTAVFNSQAGGSEIYISGLNKDSRQRLINLMVGKNFSQVVFINPELSPALIEVIEGLAQAFVSRIFVVSNENILRPTNYQTNPSVVKPLKGRALYEHWPGERTEWTVNDLLARLPETTICRTNKYSLFELVTELREQSKFRNQKDLIVTSFSTVSVLAALRLLDFPYKVDRSEKNQGGYHSYWDGLQDQPGPLSQLSTLIKSWSQDKLVQHIEVDKRASVEPILKELLTN